MGVSKVVFGNDTVMDITDSTVTSNNLLSGEIAYGANGDQVVGSYTPVDEKVKQENTTTNADYRILFSKSANDTTETETARKNTNLKYNPSTGNLQTTKINGVTVGDSPKFTDTNTKVTSVSNHYTPSEDSSAQLDADASGGSAATWNSTQLVTGVTIKRDAKGHVIGVGVDSIKLPANPNTNTTYTFASGTTNGAFQVTPSTSGATAQTVSIYGLGSAAYTNSTEYAASGHVHGNITNDGKITSNTTVANGDYLVAVDADNNKIIRTGITFGTATNKCLTQAGGWASFTNNSGTITKVTTSAGAHTAIDVSSGAVSFNVPTNTSHLTNDSGFLTAHQTIKQDGVTGATINRFGTCDTAAATAAKTVSITTGTFALEAGSTIAVKFTNANTANSPTLNVNSKGAKNVWVNGARITSGANKALLKGTVVFVYDGSVWNLIGNYYDTTYTLATVATSGSYNDLSNTPTIPSAVAVKGNAESNYRTGNVNLTPANIGALALTGGTVTGNVRIAKTGTDSSVNSYLYLGNNTAAASGGARGIIDIFSSNTYRTRIYHDTSNMQLTDDRVLYLPNVDGTILTSAGGTLTGNLEIQASSGNSQISLGNNTSDGIIGLYNSDSGAYVAITPGTLTTNRTITVPDVNGVFAYKGEDLADFDNSNTKFITSDKQVGQTYTNNTNNHDYSILFSNTYNKQTSSENNTARKGDFFFNPYYCRIYLRGTSYAYIQSSGQQTVHFAASSESDYRMCLGVVDSAWVVCPSKDHMLQLGTANYRWGQIYSSNASISTSDRNQKKDIEDLSEVSRDFIMSLKPVSYKMKDGTSGRTHCGFIAQDVEETLEDLNMTAMDFAGFCKDQKTRPVMVKEKVLDNDGEETDAEIERESSEPVEGEYVYGLRYEEFIAPLIKTVQLQQKEIDELKQEIKLLKRGSI